jgi:hypothetical protein
VYATGSLRDGRGQSCEGSDLSDPAGNVPRVIPDEIPPAPGELGAHPGDPILPIPQVGRPVRPGPVSTGQPGDEPRPTALDPEQLGFTPRRPVPWLSPVLLAGTGVRVVLAELFGAYLDKRELQDALPSEMFDERPVEGSDQGELWIDYAADTGDGFNPTYSIAYLLAQPVLDLDGTTLPRGELVVLGGDQVYPTASGQQYEDRFKGPFRAALPQPPREGRPPRLFALPGNHDWYDGLTAFLRLFARLQHGHVGGWQTQQLRSYFALRLPHRWWLFAIDAQSGAYLDDPQLRYFFHVAEHVLPGDRVILCPPTPGWVEATHDRHAYDTIDYFVRKVVQPTGAEVRVMISGDLHHYSRYSGPGRELITSGGGGAYLYPTHRLPDSIEVPPPQSLARKASPTGTYRLAAAYPTRPRSRWLALGVFGRLPWRNPSFVVLLGVVHLLTMLAFANAATQTSAAVQALVTIPASLMVVLNLLGTVGFAMPARSGNRRPRHWILGLGHGAAQIGLALAGTWAWLQLPFVHLPWPMPVALAALAYLPLIGLLSSQVFAAYLLVASAFDVNVNELFAGQGITDYKSFLKLHIGADGTLTIYSVAVDQTARRWRATPDAPADRPWFEPVRPMHPRLAEPPIRIC